MTGMDNSNRTSILSEDVVNSRMEAAIDQLERTALPEAKAMVCLVAFISSRKVVTPVQENATPSRSHEMTPLIQVLLGRHPMSKRIKIEDLKFFDESLNASQKAAVRFCLESPEVACIHGPPGQNYPAFCDDSYLKINQGPGKHTH
jgi:DNA polymerase alpha-associated DNA helicase A